MPRGGGGRDAEAPSRDAVGIEGWEEWEEVSPADWGASWAPPAELGAETRPKTILVVFKRAQNVSHRTLCSKLASRQQTSVGAKLWPTIASTHSYVGRAGSSMRLVRLKPQGPGARTARYNENLKSRTTLGVEISRKKICWYSKIFVKWHLDPSSRSARIHPATIESACKTLL